MTKKCEGIIKFDICNNKLPPLQMFRHLDKNYCNDCLLKVVNPEVEYKSFSIR